MEALMIVVLLVSAIGSGKILFSKKSEDPCKSYVQSKYAGTPKHQLLVDKCAAKVAKERSEME